MKKTETKEKTFTICGASIEYEHTEKTVITWRYDHVAVYRQSDRKRLSLETKKKKVHTEYMVHSETIVMPLSLQGACITAMYGALKSAHVNSGAQYYADLMDNLLWRSSGRGYDMAMSVYTDVLAVIDGYEKAVRYGDILPFETVGYYRSHGHIVNVKKTSEMTVTSYIKYLADRQVQDERKDVMRYSDSTIDIYTDGAISGRYILTSDDIQNGYDNTMNQGDIDILKTIETSVSDTDLLVLRQYGNGVSMADIGRQLGVCRNVVFKRVKRLKETLSVNPKVLAYKMDIDNRLARQEKELQKAIECLDKYEKETAVSDIPNGVIYSRQTAQLLCYESACITDSDITDANIRIRKWLSENACMDIDYNDGQNYTDIVSQFMD